MKPMPHRTCTLALVAVLASAFVAAGQQPMEHKSDYFPLRVGTRLLYSVGDHKVVVTVAKPVVVEMKRTELDPKKQPQEVKIKVQAYEVESKSADPAEAGKGKGFGSKSEVVGVLDDGVYRFSAAGKEFAPPLCFFKPVAGQTWQVKDDALGITGTFTCQKDTIELPALGARPVEALKVTCDDMQVGKQRVKLESWFVSGVGLVRENIHVNGSHTVNMKLEKIGP